MMSFRFRPMDPVASSSSGCCFRAARVLLNAASVTPIERMAEMSRWRFRMASDMAVAGIKIHRSKRFNKTEPTWFKA